MTLRRIFRRLFEDKTGRQLHDELDVILDMAETGASYEGALSRLRADVRRMSAMGDVRSPLSSAMKGNALGKQLAIHGRGSPDSSEYRFLDFEWGHRIPRISYVGRETDPRRIIALWREEAHSHLGLAMVDVADGAKELPSQYQFSTRMQTVEQCVDEVARLSAEARD